MVYPHLKIWKSSKWIGIFGFWIFKLSPFIIIAMKKWRNGKTSCNSNQFRFLLCSIKSILYYFFLGGRLVNACRCSKAHDFFGVFFCFIPYVCKNMTKLTWIRSCKWLNVHLILTYLLRRMSDNGITLRRPTMSRWNLATHFELKKKKLCRDLRPGFSTEAFVFGWDCSGYGYSLLIISLIIPRMAQLSTRNRKLSNIRA